MALTKIKVVITALNTLSATLSARDVTIGKEYEGNFVPAGTVTPRSNNESDHVMLRRKDEDGISITDDVGDLVTLRLSSVEATITHVEPVDRTPTEDIFETVNFRFTGLIAPANRFCRDATVGNTYVGRLYRKGSICFEHTGIYRAKEDNICFIDDVGDPVTVHVSSLSGFEIVS